MPFIGLGLHVLVALFFAVHAVRHGQPLYWLIILFSFPGLGSVVYFFAIYMPSSRIQHNVNKTVATAARLLDPGRELREAQTAFDLTPTAQNQLRLAAALLEAGSANEAATHYEACLKGPFASDPQIRLGAARARLECNHPDTAIELLEAIRASDAKAYPEQVSLLLAKAYTRCGRTADAQTELASAVSQFGTVDVRAEYAIWALDNGDHATAKQQYQEIANTVRYWSKHTRKMNRPLLDRLETAFASVRSQ